MKGLIEIIEQAAKEGKIHVVKVDAQSKDAQSKDAQPQQKIFENEFDELAKLHKQVFDAHVRVGFNENQALQLTKLVIKNMNE